MKHKGWGLKWIQTAQRWSQKACPQVQVLQSLIRAASQSPLRECAHFSGQRKIKIAAGLPNRHSHRPIHHSLALGTPGTRTPCGQTTAWPRSAAGPWYQFSAMPPYCSRSLLTIITATPSISSLAGGEKHQNTQEEEENISPSLNAEKKKIFVVLTYSGSCLDSKEKFCWSVMSGPGRPSILKLWVLFCCSLLSTSDFGEERKGGSGGFSGPVGLWVL